MTDHKDGAIGPRARVAMSHKVLGDHGRKCGNCVNCDCFGRGQWLCCLTHLATEPDKDASRCIGFYDR